MLFLLVLLCLGLGVLFNFFAVPPHTGTMEDAGAVFFLAAVGFFVIGLLYYGVPALYHLLTSA